MPDPQSVTIDPTSGRAVGRSSSDHERLTRLRALATDAPARAAAEAWAWLTELQAPSEQARLPWLFAQGTAPAGPDGDCEGIVMNLYGSPWLVGMDRLVRLGQWLGGIGWTGKTFDAATGTGFNRLTSSSRIAALVAMPTYSFTRRGDELLGFRFDHALEPSPIPPHAVVRAIRYDAPEYANPLVLPRTRDEIVELVPDVFLGRALLRGRYDFSVVGYFGLRFPRAAGQR